MNDFGLFTWDPFNHGQFLIVHWKEDLPTIVIVGFWFSVFALYMYWRDRKMKTAEQRAIPACQNQYGHKLKTRQYPRR